MKSYINKNFLVGRKMYNLLLLLLLLLVLFIFLITRPSMLEQSAYCSIIIYNYKTLYIYNILLYLIFIIVSI